MSTFSLTLQNSSLAKTMPFALLFHALIIFGIGFGIKQTSQLFPSSKLDVTIVNVHSEVAPDKADIIAQVDLLASGDTAEDNRPTSMMSASNMNPSDDISPLKSEQSSPNHPPVLQPLLLTTKGETYKYIPKVEEVPEQEEPTKVSEETTDKTYEEAQLSSELATDEANYSKMPKTRFLNSSNAKSAIEAAYIDSWAKKIERIGTTNFPKEAIRLGKSGKLIVNAILGKDGRVVSSEVQTSSGSRVLDNAALRIIKIASPYDALPLAVKQKFDRLQITRTFIFNTGVKGKGSRGLRTE
ncbi:MAG: energy transducer TonB [Thiotrichaceae bacterium]|nr:energy transducer TonB [Thiotrichaceae bacterium]